jgi:hypothetical protein
VENLKRAVVDAATREVALKEEMAKGVEAAADAANVAAGEAAIQKEKIQDLEGQLTEAVKAAAARETKIETLEVQAGKAVEEAEASRTSKAKLEKSLRLAEVKITKAKESLLENAKLLDRWRPKIYQAGYALRPVGLGWDPS